MDSLSPIHLASICLSFLSILNVLSDAFVCYHGRTLSPRLLDVVKAMIFLSIDLLIKLGVVAIGIIVFKIYLNIREYVLYIANAGLIKSDFNSVLFSHFSSIQSCSIMSNVIESCSILLSAA